MCNKTIYSYRMDVWETIRYNNVTHYNIVIHRIWAILQSDWSKYSPYISSYIRRIAKTRFSKTRKRLILVLKKTKYIKVPPNLFYKFANHIWSSTLDNAQKIMKNFTLWNSLLKTWTLIGWSLEKTVFA